MEEEIVEAGTKKKRKKPIALFIVLGVLALLASYVLVFIASVVVVYAISKTGVLADNSARAQEITDQVTSDNSGILTEEGIKKFAEVKADLEQDFMFDSSDVDFDTAVIKAYVDALGDPYTVYYTQEEYDEFVNNMSGDSFSGIGVSVQQDPDTLEIRVLKPYKNSPGANAGIQAGDIITAVDGESTEGQDIDLVVSRIRGEVGTSVVVQVYRPSEEKYYDLTVVRATINVEYVDYEMLDDNIGYISIDSFTDTTYSQFVEAYNDVVSEGAEGLVIDIRNNGGGLLTSVLNMLDLFLPECKILSVGQGTDDDDVYYSTSSQQITMPVVVLVNQYSASASEIFCGALKDYGRAKLVGVTTFGKGIVQSFYALKTGGGLKVTTDYYYLPSGNCIHKIGVEPDITVEYDENQEDNQLDAAIEALKEEMK